MDATLATLNLAPPPPDSLATRALQQGAPTLLGRVVWPDLPLAVSRLQCQLDARADVQGAVVTLTTTSTTGPTHVQRGGESLLVPPGSSLQLATGDVVAFDTTHSATLALPTPADDVVDLTGDSPERPARKADVVSLDEQPAAKRPRSLSPALPPPCAAAAGGGGRPLLLVLSGLQGSGKSTFASRLPPASWARLCQDTVSNGRRGSKEQVLVAALAALRAGRHVAIDRTNLTVEQRAPFLHLATALGCEAHAVELALPLETCKCRVLARSADHESGVAGTEGLKVLTRFANSREACTAAEGFARITRCADVAAADAALAHYAGRAPASDAVAEWREPGRQADVVEALKAFAVQQPAAPTASPLNAFAKLLASSARGRSAPSPPQRPPAASAGFKLDALQRIAASPASATGVLSYDAHLVVVRDAYPKAAFHALLVARDKGLKTVADLTAAHLPLLRAMAERAVAVVAGARQAAPSLAATPFWLGFHALPSLEPLHLHILSGDLVAPALKTRKHYNSFATPFLVPLAEVLTSVEQHGTWRFQHGDPEALLGRDLVCHRCGCHFGSAFKRLSEHLGLCAARVPAR